MNARAIVLTLVLCFAAVGVCWADNPNMGSWKLNEAKSAVIPGTPRNNTVIYTAAGDSVKITVDGVDKDGKPVHSEWTGKFDGKDYPVTGDPSSDTRSYKKINDRTLELTVKKTGKPSATGSIVVSADGKTRTVTLSGQDKTGKKVTSKSVYDKQ